MKKKCLMPAQLKAVRKIYSHHYDQNEELCAVFRLFSIEVGAHHSIYHSLFNRVEPGGDLW